MSKNAESRIEAVKISERSNGNTFTTMLGAILMHKAGIINLHRDRNLAQSRIARAVNGQHLQTCI